MAKRGSLQRFCSSCQGPQSTIIEEALLDTMYEIPSRPEIRRCVITAEALQRGQPALYDAEGHRLEDLLEQAA